MKPLSVLPPPHANKATVSFRISAEVSEMLEEISKKSGASKTGIIEQALKRSYADWKAGKK